MVEGGMNKRLDQDVAEAWAFVALHGVWVGDEHPTRKGWFLVEEPGPRGEPMWYRPPSRFSRAIRFVGQAAGLVLIGMVIAGMIIGFLTSW